jgi:hypothetical protein
MGEGLILGAEFDLLIPDPGFSRAVIIGVIGGVVTVAVLVFVALIRNRRNRTAD